MDDVALTPYHRPDSAFNFEGWQEGQAVPLVLQPHNPPPAITAPSTDSNPEEVIYSTTTQFRPSGL